MAVRGNNGGVGEAGKVGGREIGMKITQETTIKMKLTKQEKYKAMGKFAYFVHRWLVPAGGLLFVVVGLAKVASVFGEAELLGKPDPVFGLVWRELMSTSVLVYTLLLALLVCLQRV